MTCPNCLKELELVSVPGVGEYYEDCGCITHVELDGRCTASLEAELRYCSMCDFPLMDHQVGLCRGCQIKTDPYDPFFNEPLVPARGYVLSKNNVSLVPALEESLRLCNAEVPEPRLQDTEVA